MSKREKHAHGIAKLEEELLYIIQTYGTCDESAKAIYARQWRETARLIVLAVVDGEGNQILQNSDIAELRKQDAKVTNALVDAIQDHIGITDNDLEELEKN